MLCTCISCNTYWNTLIHIDLLGEDPKESVIPDPLLYSFSSFFSRFRRNWDHISVLQNQDSYHMSILYCTVSNTCPGVSQKTWWRELAWLFVAVHSKMLLIGAWKMISLTRSRPAIWHGVGDEKITFFCIDNNFFSLSDTHVQLYIFWKGLGYSIKIFINVDNIGYHGNVLINQL